MFTASGALQPLDQIVLVAVAGAHRGEAFAACEFVIDYLKTQAPFWKKEQTAERRAVGRDARQRRPGRRALVAVTPVQEWRRLPRRPCPVSGTRRALPARPQIRILFRKAIAMGPGKADLLRAIEETGSISAAARTLGMSYRRAWLLVDTMNQCFKSPVVETLTGGQKGGGARVTDLGHEVLRRYLEMEAKATGQRAEGTGAVHAPDGWALAGPR